MRERHKLELSFIIPNLFRQRIAELVPHDAYQPLLPEKSAPDFKYAAAVNDDLPGHAVAQKAVSSVKSKCTSADLLAILNELPRYVRLL